MRLARNWKGQVVGNLTVLERDGSATKNDVTRSNWLCQCKCGSRVSVTGKELGRKLDLHRGYCAPTCKIFLNNRKVRK